MTDAEPPYDIAVIGGGVNGCGIARDAAGRGWRVHLCEAGDLGGATSAMSTKLIHGGLRYLEYFKFRLVRESLLERETLWRIAPHIIWPMRFVLPVGLGRRPQWLIRLGLLVYDHIGGRSLLPPTRTLDLRRDPAGAPLKPAFARGFEYSDCWVEDARLVVLNARDAADHGATIAPRTRCLGVAREGAVWVITLRDERTRAVSRIRARALVNAAGPWVAALDGLEAAGRVRLVKGSHIVTRRLYDHDRAYFFQNADGRVMFAIPYERDFTLIGTTDLDYAGDPSAAVASPQEIAYLCDGASAYFARAVSPADAVWTYAGVRPLYDDGASAAQAATRDYVLTLDAPQGAAPLLSVYGGKITTYRRLAEAALAKLAPLLPPPRGERPGWTGRTALPGGDFPAQGFEALVADTARAHPYLDAALVRRLCRAYGTRVAPLIGAAQTQSALGRDFGAGLTEAEVRYLLAEEWAMSAQDIVWRRSKLGLRLSPAQIDALEAYVHMALLQAAR